MQQSKHRESRRLCVGN